MNVAKCVENADDGEAMIEVLLEIFTLTEDANDEEPLIADPVMHVKLQENGSVHAEKFDNTLWFFTEEMATRNKITTARYQ